MEIINYAPGVIGIQKSAVSVASTETTLLEITDPRHLEKSQISAFLKFGSFVTATKVSVRFYFSFDGGTSYYQVPVLDSSGNVLNQPDIVSASGLLQYVRDLAASGANALKITGQTDAGTAVMTTGTVVVRDN